MPMGGPGGGPGGGRGPMGGMGRGPMGGPGRGPMGGGMMPPPPPRPMGPGFGGMFGRRYPNGCMGGRGCCGCSCLPIFIVALGGIIGVAGFLLSCLF